MMLIIDAELRSCLFTIIIIVRMGVIIGLGYTVTYKNNLIRHTTYKRH